MLDENTAKARLMKRELKNVEKMVIELVKLRYKKALEKIMSEETVPQENITEEEDKLFNEFLSLAASYQDFLNGILRGRLSRIEREAPNQLLVRFLQSVPAIIGSDMKTYGPFNPEEIATLPTENARILIKQGVAVEIEEDESS